MNVFALQKRLQRIVFLLLTSKILINKGMNADIDTGLRLETYGLALCFAHEDRQKMMSFFLNKGKKK